MFERLAPRLIEKPWGCDQLPAPFDGIGFSGRIGEIWYESAQGGAAAPLMIKRIFTSERLSVQVHPDDAYAKAMGLPHGKEEAWYILSCTPDARLGLGLVRPVDHDSLRAAAMDGSIEALIDWKPVRAGDFFFVPAGTIHAIGAGISLVEIQQNADITFRLFDYNRPRPLHLDDGLAVSTARPYAPIGVDASEATDTVTPLLTDEGASFWIDLHRRRPGDHQALGGDGPLWFIPLDGAGTIEGRAWTSGECWLIESLCDVHIAQESRFLVAGARTGAALR